MKRLLLAVVVVAGCSKGKDEPKPNVALDAAVKAATAMDAASVAVTIDAAPAAATIDAAPVVAAPTTPPTTCTVGDPVLLATANRTPGDLDVAVLGDRTAVAWNDGGKTFAVVTDAAGVPVAPATQLPQSKETFVFATLTGFAVLVVDQAECSLTARTLDTAGQIGKPVELAKKVCNPQYYPSAAVRDGQILAAVTYQYEAEGLQVVRWRDGTEPAVTTLVDRDIYAAPVAVTATDTGFAVLWYENEEDPMDLSTTKMVTIDDAGVAGKPRKVEGDDLLGATPVQLGMHAGFLELRAGKSVQRLGRAKGDSTLRWFAGRWWAMLSRWQAVPLDADGAPAGAGFDAPSDAVAHDGTRGVAADWKKKELLLHALTCTGG